MSNIGTLVARIGERPPSKRWTISYLACIVAGMLLSTYAENIANKLSPPPEGDDVDAVMTSAGPAVVGEPGSLLRLADDGPYRPRRYGQCDDTCTVDCGHCKGEGPPDGSLDIETSREDDEDA